MSDQGHPGRHLVKWPIARLYPTVLHELVATSLDCPGRFPVHMRRIFQSDMIMHVQL